MRREGDGEERKKGVGGRGQGGGARREGVKPQSCPVGGAEAQEPLSKETFQTDGGA